jgi:hypothetical protein
MLQFRNLNSILYLFFCWTLSISYGFRKIINFFVNNYTDLSVAVTYCFLLSLFTALLVHTVYCT